MNDPKKTPKLEHRWWENNPNIDEDIQEALRRVDAFEFKAKPGPPKSRITPLLDCCGQPVVLKFEWKSQGRFQKLRESEKKALFPQFYIDTEWDRGLHASVHSAFWLEKKTRYLWLILNQSYRGGPAWVYTRERRLRDVVIEEERGWRGMWNLAFSINRPIIPLICDAKDTLRTMIRESLTGAITRLEEKGELPYEVREENPGYPGALATFCETITEYLEGDEALVKGLVDEHVATTRGVRIG